MIIDNLWTGIITLPGFGDLLALSSCIGIFLLLWSPRLRPPADEQMRGVGLFVAVFCLGNMLLAVIFDVNLNFQWLEIPYRQSFSIAAETSLDPAAPGLTKSGKDSPSLQQKGLRPGKPGAENKNPSPQIWKTIKIWEGANPLQTEVFTVPSANWTIDWMTVSEDGRAGNFTVKVYSSDGHLVRHAPVVRGPDQGSMSLERPGRYYIEITATQKYRVSVRVTL
jgi:hypothetical protein